MCDRGRRRHDGTAGREAARSCAGTRTKILSLQSGWRRHHLRCAGPEAAESARGTLQRWRWSDHVRATGSAKRSIARNSFGVDWRSDNPSLQASESLRFSTTYVRWRRNNGVNSSKRLIGTLGRRQRNSGHRRISGQTGCSRSHGHFQIRRDDQFRSAAILCRDGHGFRCTCGGGVTGPCFVRVGQRRTAAGIGERLGRRVVKRLGGPIGLIDVRTRARGPALHQGPARGHDHEVPQQRLLDRSPGQAAGYENIVPELARGRSQLQGKSGFAGKGIG